MLLCYCSSAFFAQELKLPWPPALLHTVMKKTFQQKRWKCCIKPSKTRPDLRLKQGSPWHTLSILEVMFMWPVSLSFELDSDRAIVSQRVWPYRWAVRKSSWRAFGPLAPPCEENVVPGEGHSGAARGEIIRQIERVSFREDPAGGIGLGVENG